MRLVAAVCVNVGPHCHVRVKPLDLIATLAPANVNVQQISLLVLHLKHVIELLTVMRVLVFVENPAHVPTFPDQPV